MRKFLSTRIPAVVLCATSIALWIEAALVQAQTVTAGLDFRLITPSTNLQWQPCQVGFYCALLDVPLDYAKPDGLRASVPLIKYPAADNSSFGPYKGMILLNPGGPGGSGVEFLVAQAPSLHTVTSTNYDLVSFDPRGIGSSIPSANCTILPAQSSTKARRGLLKIYGPKFVRSFFDNLFTEAKVLGEQCQRIIGGDDQAGPHMTTSVNVKDMISILNAFAQTDAAKRIDNASLLNYWGISYGTYIGQSFASMFPDRVGRVILDGVLDPEVYSSGLALHAFVSTNAIYSSFFVYCHLAGPALCPYYTGTTARDIYTRFEASFTKLNARHALAQKWANATIIEEALETIKETMLTVAYQPIPLFPVLASVLVTLEEALKNGTLATSIPKLTGGLVRPVDNSTLWEPAVQCTDDGGASYNKTYAEILPYIHKLEKESVIFGDLWSSLRISCTGWSIKPTERFAGPFGGHTKNPMLFVSNTLDPVTPLRNGRKWSSRYEDSQLLTIEGIGHTSGATGNMCAANKIQIFFQRGPLPTRETHCEQEVGPFNVTLPERLEKRDDWNNVESLMPRLRHN